MERDKHVRQTGEQRGAEHEKHKGTVHRKELVKLLLRLQDLHTGLKKLDTHQQSHSSAHTEEDEGRDQVHVPNGFVVRGSNPIDKDASLGLRNHARRNSRCTLS